MTWSTLGRDENDSMPLGNGDLAANVWTEQNGDIVVLLAKADAWSELGKLDKLARLRIHFANNPFAGSSGFVQTLHLENGSLSLQQGETHLVVWVDANLPVLHINGKLASPTAAEAHLEVWRNRTHTYNEPSPDRGGLFGLGGFGASPHPLPVSFAPDTVLPAHGDTLTWYHDNPESIYPVVLAQQHLQQLASRHPDPLLHRCFGGSMQARGMTARDDRTLVSSEPQSELRVDVVALTTIAPDTPAVWQHKLEALQQRAAHASLDQAWNDSAGWWNSFWNRSWIQVAGTESARAVDQGYAMQRYMMAVSSRGQYPVKFNGGLFTVGRDMPENVDSTPGRHNPDFRQWGSAYWNQNERHLYWPLIASGDDDLLKPWFDMYVNALPLARDRTRTYYGHDGAAFIETINFWGLPTLNDFGWNNSTDQVGSPYMRYHTQGGLEVADQMLDTYEITGDSTFLRDRVIPFADAILTYYAQHWKKGTDGKLRLFPAQSIETYQLDAVNPAPDIAGIQAVAGRLLQLPSGSASQAQRKAWQQLLASLPPLPLGTMLLGKLPPLAQGDPDGKPTLLPALAYGKSRNTENPELYAVFPYRLYGTGKPDLQLARDTYAARLFPFAYCWGQDPEEAALLGLTAEAARGVTTEFTHYGDQHFSWFWSRANDWIPDLDNGGAGATALQFMLMQTDGSRILLVPAWPAEWTADFKLHASRQTTVEAHVEKGVVTRLNVLPASRAKDVVILRPQSETPTASVLP